MDSTTESTLLAKITTTDLTTNTFSLFSTYLHPFTFLLHPPPNKTLTSSTTARSLAKQFLPFLNKTLSLLPKLLSTPTIPSQSTLQLFQIYALCLDCLDCVSSQLSCKPFSVHIQRVRLIHCFEACGRYKDAEIEGFRVLQSLQGKAKAKFVPQFSDKESVDPEFGLVVLEIVVTLVKCASVNQSREEGDYQRVLVLVDEVTPWFRVLDANKYEKMHRALVSYLSKCTLFLVVELRCFNGDLVWEFCSATFTEHKKSSMKDQMYKFARRICSSILSQQDSQSLFIINILVSVLDAVAHECKVGMESAITEYLELVCYCANKCRMTTTNFCGAIATHLYKIAGNFSQVLSPIYPILVLFYTGLFISDFTAEARRGDACTTLRNAKDESVIGFLLSNEHRLQHLTSALALLRHHFRIGDKENNLTHNAEYKNNVQVHSRVKFKHEAPILCAENGMAYLLFYCNALKFLCHPLAEFVNLERKEFITEIEGAPIASQLCIIQDAFHQLCDVFLLCSSASERERDSFDDNSKTVLNVAVAAFTLSIRTKHKIKVCVNFIKHVMSSDWIQANGLKYIFTSLYNVGVILYRNKQLKEASKALKLSCGASWKCVFHLCEMFADKSNARHDDLSEDAIVSFISEACAKSAFFLDVLFQSGSKKMKRVIRDTLESWSMAENLFKTLQSPQALVRQWVKIECKLFKDLGVEHSATTLYSLLSTSAEVSKKTLGILLELELLAYKEMESLSRGLCQRMRMDIIAILLKTVYATKDSCLQKSRILIAKGMELRACGIEGLNECIQCLSEAISTLNGMCGDTFDCSIVRQQLADAYCLHALFTQEAEPNSKQIFQDIRDALNLWMSSNPCHAADHSDMMSDNMLILLYHVVDLLSVKGNMNFHPDIYEILIRLFKCKNIPLEKCLAMLWEYRRLGHALCVSSVNDAFITTLSKHCGEPSKSINFWISCMKGSEALRVGFQQNLCLMFNTSSSGSYLGRSSFQSDITVDDVKQAASELIFRVPRSSGSVFIAAHLYYDLSEKLASSGRLIEALSYAKEAHQLCSKLLQEKFMYTVEQQNEVYDDNGEIIQKCYYGLKTFKMYDLVATTAWSCQSFSCDFESCILTPWNVLQCYLESTLQVAVFHEIIGNGSEAETLLLWGKNISCSQGLPLFIVAFSSFLGKLYRKQQLWDLAEKEIRTAKQILADSCTIVSCPKCRLVLEVAIDQQLGDLIRSHFDLNTENPSLERLSHAENVYRSALDKLNVSEWKKSVSNPGDTLVKDGSYGDNICHCGTNNSDVREFPSKSDGPETKMEGRRSRKSKKAIKPIGPIPAEQTLMPEPNVRMTRSRYRSQKNNESIAGDVQIRPNKYSKSKHVFPCPDAHSQQVPHPEIKNLPTDGLEYSCACNNVKCLHCLPNEILESGSMNNFIHMKWELVCRRLSSRLLISIGKCLGMRGDNHETHEIFLQSISMLVSRNPFCAMYSSGLLNFLLDLLGKDILGNVLAVEHAATLYNICWFTLKSYSSKGTRIICCDMSSIEMPRILSWLTLAFVLCREVPTLFQKVSRLLAALYVISTSKKTFSLSPGKALSESQWASYFHQASLGTHINHQLFTSMIGKQKAQNPIDLEVSCPSSSTSIGSETIKAPRLAPETLQDLEGCAINFFQDLPCSTVICVSLLGGAYASFLRELLLYPASVHSWILLSRLKSNCQPVVILLPVDAILEEASDDEDAANSGSGILYDCKNSVKRWHCPWGTTVVDEVAPVFRRILTENYLSSSKYPLEDTKESRSLWWMQRKRLDRRLGNFLRDLEDSWFGPWKYLLLGEWSDCKHLDSVQKKLADDLKFEYEVDIDESLLKVVLAGAKDMSDREECVLQLILNKGCYIGGAGYQDQERSRTLSYTCNAEEKSVFKLLLERVHEFEEDECLNREPIILVLDFEVQMLPWENLPILRNQEVYRMPSVGSISASLDRCCRGPELIGTNALVFPEIDPIDAYYVLNPSGDLRGTQTEFENWFRDQNIEGKTGIAPTVEELTVALKGHDLFIYFGHGSGAQYIPGHTIQKLENCAATLLMGCSSGSLSLKGCYTPQGAPLHYLLAGSPVIVANLWEVTDKDIDRFGKAMLDAWWKERSADSMACAQCNLVSKEFESMNLGGSRRNAKKKILKEKLPEDWDNDCCKHRPKIGSFMGQARDACTLPFLIGAAPVCYGVPTGIKKKKDL